MNLDISFTALAGIARPFLQETISESPPTEQVAIDQFPLQRPFLRNQAALFRELRPGVATLPHSAPILADAFEAGTRVLPKTKQTNRDLADVFDSLAEFSDDAMARGGIQMLTRLSSSLKPTLRFLVPAQTVCNYATLWFRNAASLLSDGDPNGTWQRFMVVAAPTQRSSNVFGPNNEGFPVERARQRAPGREPHAREPVPEHRRTGADAASARRATRATRAARRWPGTCPATRARKTSRPERRLGHGDGAMRTRPGPGRFTPVQAGLIALVVILIVTFLGVHEGHPVHEAVRAQGASSRTRRRSTKGQAVRIAGVDVGQVSKIEPVGGDSPAITVTMKLQDKALPIHKRRPHQGPPAHLLRGQPLLRRPAGHARRAPSSTAATRSRSRRPGAGAARPGARGRSRRTPARTSRSSWSGYGDALNGKPLPGEDADQDPTRRARPPRKSLNDSLEYSRRALRGVRS